MARPALELAAIFRRHGEAYRQAHPLPCQQRRVMRCNRDLPHGGLGGSVNNAATVNTFASATTPAAIGIAPSANPWRAPDGWKRGSPSCCRRKISPSAGAQAHRRLISGNATKVFASPPIPLLECALFADQLGDRARDDVKYSTGNNSDFLAFSHRARARDWHLGQCRLRQEL